MRKKIIKTIFISLLIIIILTDNVQVIYSVENNLVLDQTEDADAYVENTKPVKPIIVLKRKKNKVTVTIKNWKKNTLYQVYVKKNGKYRHIKTIKRKKYTFNFNRNKVCRVKVRAIIKTEESTIYSCFAKKMLSSELKYKRAGAAAQRILHKYLKNGKQYMGQQGKRMFYLYENKNGCWINIKKSDDSFSSSLYGLEYVKKISGNNQKVRQSYKVKFERRSELRTEGLYGKIFIMKNGKIILKVKSGRKLANNKIRIKKKYRIILSELDENEKINIYY